MNAFPVDEPNLRVSGVFTPAMPIHDADLFAGRRDQLRKINDVVNQRGQHAIIFGERGVGKTSLANIIATRLFSGTPPILAPRAACDVTDTYETLWRKVLLQVTVSGQRAGMGFEAPPHHEEETVAALMPPTFGPDDVRRALTRLGSHNVVIVIIDELDRATNPALRRGLADTIKSFSDNAVPATIILVGVADSVDSLIQEHQSIERCLVQVRMPRMSAVEINAILENGARKLGVRFHPTAAAEIIALSLGLPHYAHLLALHGVRACLDEGAGIEVRPPHVDIAIRQAVDDAQQSLRSAYRAAVASPRKDAIYAQVLLACAMAATDTFGHFTAADVRAPLSRIMGRDYQIPGFAKHLNDFSGAGRGPVLEKTGVKHKFKFRFVNPLMQPLIIMQGLMDRRIDKPTVEFLTAGHRP